MWRKLSRPLFLTLGFVCLGLGFAGVFLPVLPTTPFILLAAFAFSKSSRRLHAWVLGHKIFGPLVVNWQRHGVIRTRVKWSATASIVILGGPSLYFLGVPTWAKALLTAICACVVCFILTRPGEIREAEETEQADSSRADR